MPLFFIASRNGGNSFTIASHSAYSTASYGTERTTQTILI